MIKEKQQEILLHDFEFLSKTILTQLQIVSKLMQDNTIQSLYDEAETNEIIIDRLEIKIKEEVVFSIFKFNPVASDLRQIISYQDITLYLERVGDMLLNITHFLRDINFKNSSIENIRKTLYKMMGYSFEMIRNSIISFSTHDGKTAYKVIKEDDKVDQFFHQINLSLQELYAGKQVNLEDIKSIINLSGISHNLERIGDNATNIAESTIYLTEGKDIRHGNQE